MRQPLRCTTSLCNRTRVRFCPRRRLLTLACDGIDRRSWVIRRVRCFHRRAAGSARDVLSLPSAAPSRRQHSGSLNLGIGLPVTTRKISDLPRERPEHGISGNPAFVMIGRSTGTLSLRRVVNDACSQVLVMKSAPVRPDRHVGRAMALDHVDGTGTRSGSGR